MQRTDNDDDDDNNNDWTTKMPYRCTLYQHNIIEFVPYMCYLHASLTVSISIMIWRYEKFLTPKFMLYPRV